MMSEAKEGLPVMQNPNYSFGLCCQAGLSLMTSLRQSGSRGFWNKPHVHCTLYILPRHPQEMKCENTNVVVSMTCLCCPSSFRWIAALLVFLSFSVSLTFALLSYYYSFSSLISVVMRRLKMCAEMLIPPN